MKKFLIAGVLAASTVIATPAFAAFGISQSLTFNPTSSGFSSAFGNSGGTSAGFVDTYTFELSDIFPSGTGAATGSLITISLTTSNVVTIAGVTLNSGGVLTPYTPNAVVDLGGGTLQYSFSLPMTSLQGSGANPDQIISVSGSTLTGGSYSGTFNLTAVPEPGTWALMLTGFGAVGYSLRRRKAYQLVQAV